MTNDFETCLCCPYGFHIDLDFVKYAENVANGDYKQHLRQMRRAQKKMCKSMNHFEMSQIKKEENEASEMDKSDLFSPLQSVFSDSMENVISDFEEALHPYEQSRHIQDHTMTSVPETGPFFERQGSIYCQNRAKNATNTFMSDNLQGYASPKMLIKNRTHFGNGCVNSANHANTSFINEADLSESTSSLSSISPINDPLPQYKGLSDEIAANMSTLAAILESSNNAQLVAIFRTNIDVTLNHVRALESQVKNIPKLSDRIAVLKREKCCLASDLEWGKMPNYSNSPPKTNVQHSDSVKLPACYSTAVAKAMSKVNRIEPESDLLIRSRFRSSLRRPTNNILWPSKPLKVDSFQSFQRDISHRPPEMDTTVGDLKLTLKDSPVDFEVPTREIAANRSCENSRSYGLMVAIKERANIVNNSVKTETITMGKTAGMTRIVGVDKSAQVGRMFVVKNANTNTVPFADKLNIPGNTVLYTEKSDAATTTVLFADKSDVATNTVSSVKYSNIATNTVPPVQKSDISTNTLPLDEKSDIEPNAIPPANDIILSSTLSDVGPSTVSFDVDSTTFSVSNSDQSSPTGRFSPKKRRFFHSIGIVTDPIDRNEIGVETVRIFRQVNTRSSNTDRRKTDDFQTQTDIGTDRTNSTVQTEKVSVEDGKLRDSGTNPDENCSNVRAEVDSCREPRIITYSEMADSFWLLPNRTLVSTCDVGVGGDLHKSLEEMPPLRKFPNDPPSEHLSNHFCQKCRHSERTFSRNVGVGICSVSDRICTYCNENRHSLNSNSNEEIDENRPPGFGDPAEKKRTIDKAKVDVIEKGESELRDDISINVGIISGEYKVQSESCEIVVRKPVKIDLKKPKPTRAFELSRAAALRKLLTSEKKSGNDSDFQRGTGLTRSLRVQTRKGDSLIYITDKKHNGEPLRDNGKQEKEEERQQKMTDRQQMEVEDRQNEAGNQQIEVLNQKNEATIKENEAGNTLSKEALKNKVPLKKPGPCSKFPTPVPARIPRPKVSKYAVGPAKAQTSDEEAEVDDKITPLPSEMRPLRSWPRPSKMDEQRQKAGQMSIFYENPLALEDENDDGKDKRPVIGRLVGQVVDQLLPGVEQIDLECSSDSDENSPSEGSYDTKRQLISSHCPESFESPPFRVTELLKEACEIQHKFIRGATILQEKQDWSLKYLQAEWLKAAARRSSNANFVESFMDVLEMYSKQLLRKVINLCDQNTNSALHYAVSHGNFDVVSQLLDSKVCDLNRTNKAGYTPVMLAALCPLTDDTETTVVQRLFQMGNVNVKAEQHGQTALMLAVSHGKTKTVSLLLDAGAGVNIQDEDGSTALMCACEHGHADIVSILLGHPELNATISDHDSSTALSIAVENGHRDIAVLIYAHLNYSNSTGHQSLDGSRTDNST